MRRAAILDAALEVFAESGFRSGSLREIAQRVRLSEAGVLHHFPGKSALLMAALDHRDERALRIVGVTPGDGLSTLRGMVELARTDARTPGVIELYCILSAEATDPDHPAHAYFVARYQMVRDLLSEAFAEVAGRGLLVPGIDPGRAASSTIAVWDGLQVQWLLDREGVDLADELARHIGRLLTVPLPAGRRPSRRGRTLA
jgi:AcrR family transcriptional regulator